MYAMTMTVNHFQFEAQKWGRILLIALVLTVGSLQVTRCSDNDNTYADHEHLAQEVKNKFK